MNNSNFFNKEVLKTLLLNYGISEKQLAEKLGFSEIKVKSWLDNTGTPTYNQLIKIAESFKKPVIIFFMENPQ